MAFGRRSLLVSMLAIAFAAFGAVADTWAQQARRDAAPKARSRVPVPALYASSEQPYWRVGDADKRLSVLCQKGEFNQIERYRWIIGYGGKRGAGVTGIANPAWNLYDPHRLALADHTYHFFNDGFSNCRVFSARLKPGRR